MGRSICIISFSPIHRDARVLRQIQYLSPHYDLTVIGYGPPSADWVDAPHIQWHRLPETISWIEKYYGLFLLFLGKFAPSVYDYWYWRITEHRQALAIALATPCDAIHANDLESLPVAIKVAEKNGAHVVFDVHEYAPLELENRLYWRMLYPPCIRRILQDYSPRIDAAVTVAPAIAARYKAEFNFTPLVVLNVPEHVALAPHQKNDCRIHLIYHGGANADRRLETMLETLSLCDQRFHLHIMPTNPNSPYVKHIRRLAERQTPGRVEFHDPVAPAEVVRRIAEYDMGFYLLAPNSYNNRVALPNKFFDFIAAGLAVAIGPSPSMAEIVEQYGCGCVAPSFEPRVVAAMLNRINAQELQRMQQAARRASQDLNAAKEMTKITALYERMFARGG